MDTHTLELSRFEQRLISMYQRWGPAGIIAMVTMIALSLSVITTTGLSMYLFDDFQWDTFLPYLILAVIVPLMVAPTASFIIVRLLGKLELAYQSVMRISTTDPLTGSANRRGFLSAASQNIHTLQEAESCLVGMADLDRFKSINDTHGHKTGDEALQLYASRLDAEIGQLGVVGRLGGDEFAFIALGTETTLFRLRNRLEDNCRDIELPNGLEIQCSIGMVTLEQNETLESALARADKQLYESKRNRHQVWLAKAS